MLPARATRSSWLLWTVAVVVYLLSVFHRSTLGVAGLQATTRFGIGPAELSVFTVLQVAVYAAMQVPTGLLVDRFGPRVTLTCAASLLGIGEIGFGLAHSYPLAVAARAVLGMGDAMTFVSVLRVVAGRFPARTYPLVVSLTSMLGSVGNLAATMPLTLLLAGFGWTTTFLLAGLVTAAYAGVVAVGLRAPANPEPAHEPVPVREVLRGVRRAWRVPGTRLGFWTHFTTMVGPTTLGLLWGFPYLVKAWHLTPVAADEVLAVLVFGAMIGNPVIGAVTSRYRVIRMPIVLGYLVAAAGTWLLLLAGPATLPVWVLVVAFAVLALGGPISAVGFALARDYNPMHRVGTATGVVNVGGFLATTVAALGVGLLVGWLDTAPAATAYRIGLLAVVAVLAVGSCRVVVWWRRARAEVFAAELRGEPVPVRLRRRRWDSRPELPVPA